MEIDSAKEAVATLKAAGKYHPVRWALEYGSLVFLGTIFRFLPHVVAQAIAYVIARVAFLLMGSRRREAVRRLKLVVGALHSEGELRKMAWISFRNTAFNAVDMLRIRSFDLKALKRQIPQCDEAIAHIKDVLSKAEGRGAILALPHCGNWDLCGSAVFLSGLGIFSVAGKQRNPYMNRLLNKMRSGHGMDILERGESGGRTYMQMLRRVRKGEIFAILPDSRSFQPALSVPFLGGAANLARGMGLLAIQANAPIIPLVVRRVGWRRFELEIFPTLWPIASADRNEEELRLTRQVIGCFDSAIRKTPEQWFWYNKRWVLDPVQQGG